MKGEEGCHSDRTCYREWWRSTYIETLEREEKVVTIESIWDYLRTNLVMSSDDLLEVRRSKKKKEKRGLDFCWWSKNYSVTYGGH